MDIVNELRGHLTGKIVTDAVVGNTYYAAIKSTGKDVTFAFIAMLKGDRGYGWGYKDMDEFCGPYVNTCPARVLDALTPIDDIIAVEGKTESHDWAARWRNDCRQRLAKAAAQRKVAKTLTLGQSVYILNAKDPHRPYTLVTLPAKGVSARVARDYVTYRVSATRLSPTGPVTPVEGV